MLAKKEGETSAAGRVTVSVVKITVSEKGLQAMWDGISTLAKEKRIRGTVHVTLRECVLSSGCCELLLKPPRNVTSITLERCVFDKGKFGIKFEVSQSVTLK